MIKSNKNMDKKQSFVTWIRIVYIKTEDICADIANDFETRFDTSNYELGRPLLKRITKI